MQNSDKMKNFGKILLFLSVVVLFLVSIPVNAFAAEDPAQILTDPGFNLYSVDASTLDSWYGKIVDIPDKGLKEALLADLGMSAGEITVFKMLYNLPDTLEYSHLAIKDLTGLEYAINVKKIYLGNNEISSADATEPLKNLYNLEVLDLSRNKLEEIPGFLFDMPSLISLNVSDNLIEKIDSISGENVLEELYMENNHLTALPQMDKLTELKTLSLSGNELESFPDEVSSLKKLTALALADNKLSEFPDMSVFEQLAVINLEGNELSEFPTGIDKLTNLIQIDISENNISEIPDGVFSMPNLSALFMSFNELETIPDGLLNMEKLSVIDVSMNRIDLFANAPIIENLRNKLNENSFLYRMQYQILSLNISQDPETKQPVLHFDGIGNVSVPEGKLSVDSVEITRREIDSDNAPSVFTVSFEDEFTPEYLDMEADMRNNYEYSAKAIVKGEYLGSIDISFETESTADTLSMSGASEGFVFDTSMIVVIVVAVVVLALVIIVSSNTKRKKKEIQ